MESQLEDAGLVDCEMSLLIFDEKFYVFGITPVQETAANTFMILVQLLVLKGN